MLAEVTAAAGVRRDGQLPGGLHGRLDAGATARRPTEILVDRASDETVVIEAGAEPWRDPGGSTDALTDLVLTRGRERAFSPVGERAVLDRECLDYLFTLEGDEQDGPLRAPRSAGWSPGRTSCGASCGTPTTPGAG